MGNAPASLGIVINEQVIHSGGQLSGCVYLQVTKRCVANTLQVVVEGYEHSHAHWTTREKVKGPKHSSGSRPITVHHDAHASRPLVYIDVPLASFSSGAVEPGRYEYPFSTVLPLGLPSVMYVTQGGGDCRVHYSLTARLHRPGMFKWDVTTKVPFAVQAQALPPSKQPLYAQPETALVNLCCCLSRGSMTLGAVVDETFLWRGQTVGVGIAVKNESAAKVHGLFVKIFEVVDWKAGGHSHCLERGLAQAHVAVEAIDGLAPVSKEARKGGRQDAESRYRTYEELHATLTGGKQRVSLRVSPAALDTYVGSVLSVSHRIQIELVTPFCVTNPVLQVPVRVQELLGTVSQNVTAVAVPIDAAEKAAIRNLPSDWNNAIVNEPLVLPMGQAVVGGVLSETNEQVEEQDNAVARAQVQVKEVGTLDALMRRMDTTVDGLVLIQLLLGQDDSVNDDANAWRSLFSALGPREFGQIVGKVQLEFDQPRVAELLARNLTTFTGAHILSTIRSVAPNQRAPVVNVLVPLCVEQLDASQRDLIFNELTMWERKLTRAVLGGDQQALV